MGRYPSWLSLVKHKTGSVLLLVSCLWELSRWSGQNLRQSGDDDAARSPSVLSLLGSGDRGPETLREDHSDPLCRRSSRDPAFDLGNLFLPDKGSHDPIG